MKENMIYTNRQIELDLLRIIALIAVIFTHASGVADGPLSEKETVVHTFLTSIVTWHVPIFVMISGRFFLDEEREISFVKIKKSITRLLFAFIFWNIIYQFYYILSGTYNGLNWKGVLFEALLGPYHFWYLYMIIGLYVITPFLRKISQERRLLECYIILFIVSQFILVYGVNLPIIGNLIDVLFSKVNFHFSLGYSGYYVLGYYLYKYPLSKKYENIVYALGVLMLMFTGVSNCWMLVQGVEGEEWFSKYLYPNVIMEGIALYTFFVKRVSQFKFSDIQKKIIVKLSEYSFGVYLIHALILEIKLPFESLSISMHPFLSIFIKVIIAFIISNMIIYLIKKIPYLRKIVS